MKKIILTLLSLSVIGAASTVDAQDFNIAAKHAIAVEANTGKILYLFTYGALLKLLLTRIKKLSKVTKSRQIPKLNITHR